jgi:hypothetical protein
LTYVSRGILVKRSWLSNSQWLQPDPVWMPGSQSSVVNGGQNTCRRVHLEKICICANHSYYAVVICTPLPAELCNDAICTAAQPASSWLHEVS